MLPRLVPGISVATWNIFEAGHGKSAAAAVGGVLKRSADSAVDHGNDTPDAQTFYDIIKDRTKVVDEKAIDSVVENILIGLKGLAQAKIIKKSGILFWLLNMTI